ncbi:phage portal protein [Lactococcus fujiensis]|uniref:phage portal protein n=1 Tax=Lactococcus fujiensis TaxID=610251 RepID=UPI0015DD6C8F|nr:phage portal protein [Lactococcus fujiensis]
MGLFSDVWSSITSRFSNSTFSGYDALFDAQVHTNMKTVALDSCSAYLARLVAKGKFVFKTDGTISDNEFEYALNVRPNPNQTATEFKNMLVRKLLNGEVLVIKDNDKFFIADNFIKQYSLDGNTFTGVTINFSTDVSISPPGTGIYAQKYFKQTFSQGVDCFYLKHENIGLDEYVDGLWKDYGRLYGILITNQLRVGQLRAKVTIPVNSKLEDDEKVKIQKQYADTLTKNLLNDPIVILPGGDKSQSAYDEISASKAATIQNQITDFANLKKTYIGDVANLIGLPTALVLGETANNSENLDLAIEIAVKPIANKICEALGSLIIKESGYSVGKTIEMTGFKSVNILDRADAIDKVGSSGVVKVNEVREAAGLIPLPDGDKIIMTKNYQKEGVTSENT